MFKFGLLLFSILFLISYNIFGDTIRGTSGEKFEGEKIVVVSVSGDQGEFLKKVAKEWENQTGATIELNLIL